MAKVNLKELIARLPDEEQKAIRAQTDKINAGRIEARRLVDGMAKDGAEKLLSKAA